MIRLLICISIGMTLSSCLKKIDEMDNLNTNIFDPEYAGDKWYSIDDAYLYTNSFNDQYVRIEYSIPESAVPTIQPTGISIMSQCNNYPAEPDSAILSYKGHYEGVLQYLPDGSTEYCIDLGIYIWDKDTTINRFSECVSL